MDPRPLQNPKEDQIVLTAGRASERSINLALDRLGEWLRAKRLRKGDIVAVVITAHLLEFDKTSVIAAVDTDRPRSPSRAPMIVARDISERLGELADYGCRVVVFLDGVHELPGEALRSTHQAVGAGPCSESGGSSRSWPHAKVPAASDVPHSTVISPSDVTRAFQASGRGRQVAGTNPTRWMSSAVRCVRWSWT